MDKQNGSSTVFTQPRFWLFLVLAAGVLGVMYVIIAASVYPRRADEPSALAHSQELLVGEMADFEYAFPPRAAPAISFSKDGSPVTLADFKGRAVLVNFWATWCAPCLKELPSLDALQAKFKTRNFEVVAIASDPRGPEVAQEFLDRLEIENLQLYADPQLAMVMAYGGANVLPLSVLYDADGREIGRMVGEADWGSP
ncbi:MAG: TlpA family protein disulfide reductase, partial [Marinicaulis sp.]|nr:TlpA family protein disulfide reductase [Marinicaulis sp.]